MADHLDDSREVITLGDLLRLIWDGKFAFVGIIVGTVLAFLAAYLTISPSYRTSVDILPLRASAFAAYLPITGEDTFPHRPETMLAGFARTAQDSEIIEQSAEAAAMLVPNSELDRDTMLRDLLRRLTFDPASVDARLDSFRISLTSGNPEAAGKFLKEHIARSSQRTATEMAAEVEQSLAARRMVAELEATQVQLEIDALRQRLAAQKADRIALLREQAAIARALGIERSPEQRVLDTVEAGSSANVQITALTQPVDSYQNGYAALEAQIAQLEEMDVGELGDERLRELEERLFVLRQDRVVEEIRSRLAQTPLADPAAAQVVRYSEATLQSTRLSPRLELFVAGGLAAGVVLGLAFVIGRRLMASTSRVAG